MSFLELCRRRRSIRKFTSESVSDEVLNQILQCALMSPSSKRSNPWFFYVMKKREQIDPLAACKTYGSQMMQTAQAVIVVAADTSSDTWQCDASIAAEHILLAAADNGLGACWCHIYQREGAEEMVRNIAHIPTEQAILCAIALGHKDEERREYDLDKLLYEKVKVVEN